MTRPLAASAAAGLALGALAWIDPLFVPLVLAGPIITGAVAGAKGKALRWVALAWAVAGVSMIASDWVLNHEDRLFHAALTLVMIVFATAGWLAGARLERRRTARAVPEH